MSLKLRAKANSRLGTLEAFATGNFPSSNFWTLHIYSTGRTMKNNMSIPKFKRRSVSSNHGFSWATKEVDADAKMPSKTHLTRSFGRHHSEFFEKKETAGVEELIENSGSQGNLEDPYFYCLHLQDVNVGLHQEFLSQGRAVATARSSSSPYLSIRLYKILSGHENAVSFTPRTQALLIQEFGLKSSISPLPNEPKLGRVKPVHRGETDEVLLDPFIMEFSNIESVRSAEETKRKWLFLVLRALEHGFEAPTGGLKASRLVDSKRRPAQC